VYTIILGDLIGSRKVSDRRVAAKRIRDSLARVSMTWKSGLIAPVVLEKGIDEIAGVLGPPRSSYGISRQINEAIYPLKFRFTIAVGEIDIGIGTRDVAKMDGPAFHTAAKLMEAAKRNGSTYSFQLDRGGPTLRDEWLSTTANLIDLLLARRSARQREIALLYSELRNQAEVAARLGITQQAVSNAVHLSRWSEVEHAEGIITRILANAGKASEG